MQPARALFSVCVHLTLHPLLYFTLSTYRDHMKLVSCNIPNKKIASKKECLLGTVRLDGAQQKAESDVVGGAGRREVSAIQGTSDPTSIV